MTTGIHFYGSPAKILFKAGAIGFEDACCCIPPCAKCGAGHTPPHLTMVVYGLTGANAGLNGTYELTTAGSGSLTGAGPCHFGIHIPAVNGYDQIDYVLDYGAVGGRIYTNGSTSSLAPLIEAYDMSTHDCLAFSTTLNIYNSSFVVIGHADLSAP